MTRRYTNRHGSRVWVTAKPYRLGQDSWLFESWPWQSTLVELNYYKGLTRPMSLWRENLLLYICSRFGEALQRLQTFLEASTQMPPSRVFILGKRIGSGGFVSLHSFYWSSLVFKFDSLLWPAEPSFRRHGLHWRSLRNKKSRASLTLKRTLLKYKANFFKLLDGHPSHTKVVQIWPFRTFRIFGNWTSRKISLGRR